QISSSLFNISFTHFYKGDIDIAQEFADKCFSICETHNLSEKILEVYTLYGTIYRGRGNLEVALEYYNKALSKYKEKAKTQEKMSHSYCYVNRCIGEVLFLQNKIEESIEWFKNGINAHFSACILKNTILDYDILTDHIMLIGACLEINDEKQIDASLEVLSTYAEKWPWTAMFLKAGQASVLATKERAKYKIQAQQLYEEALEHTFDYEGEHFIKVGLCNLLLDELRYSGTKDILYEIQNLLQSISEIANKQHSLVTLLSFYSLQARLALFEGDVESANEILAKALTIASNSGFELFVKQIKIQQNELITQLEEWKALFNRNLKLQENIEFFDLKNDLTEAITDVLEKKFNKILDPLKLEDEEPTLLLIITQGGVIIFSYPFSDELRFDNELFGSFLDAFNSFSGELFSKGLARAKFGDHTVLMEPLGFFSVCYVFKGQTYVAKQKLIKFMEGLQSHESIMQTLDKFYKTSQVVDTTDLPALESLIGEIFIHH
ncbi:MAG: tetratricopeptide repeat protein, partial [Promethearchaeota archaeon]